MVARRLMVKLSKGVQKAISPPIPQAYKWAASYVATPEKPLLDMSQGAPGYPPPSSVLQNLALAASDPKNCGYGPMTGELKMRQALAREMKTVYGKDIDVTANDIAITAGCNMAFVTAIMCLADAGDEVILPYPWYFNHQMTLDMLNIQTVPLKTLPGDRFMPSIGRCAPLITSKTKAIVLTSPNNPTGAIYSPDLIASFASLARSHNIALIIDETYRDFILDGPPHRLFSAKSCSRLPSDWSWRNTFVHLFSFSKSYCIPGHRLGAIVAPADVMEQTKTVLDCIQICAPRSIQVALEPLLPELRPFIRETATSLRHRHDIFESSLPAAWKIGSQGGYYAFVRHPFKGVPALDVSRRLAMDAGVITLPAAFFSPRPAADTLTEVGTDEDSDRWIRFSVANVDDEKVRSVCARLAEAETSFNWDIN